MAAAAYEIDPKLFVGDSSIRHIKNQYNTKKPDKNNQLAAKLDKNNTLQQLAAIIERMDKKQEQIGSFRHKKVDS